jgi:glyoxylase-like metal-dependent hydrolase (beta-lactamase superfamily II)
MLFRFAFAALMFLAAPNAWGQAAGIPFDMRERVTTELAPGLYTYGSFSRRSIFVVTPEGVIATDPVDPAFAADMRAAIRKVTDRPVKYLVYSHQHWDHVRGGKVFKDEGAEVISHENCTKHFTNTPNADVVMPDRTVKGGESIELGGKSLKLLYFGRNHGDCMLVMQLAGTDVLYINDLVTPYSLGLGFMPDYDPNEWARTLRELEARPDWARIVGGHGVPFGGRDAVTQRRRFIEQLMTAVKTQFDQGKSLDRIMADTDLPEFRDVRGYKEQIGRAAERIYHYYEMGW